ncbi:MAG: hypothetical protein ABI986_07270 [Chloroflexota bacterium]
MKKITLALLCILLMGCDSATPVPITVNLGAEFTLAPDQAATITDTNLTLHLIGVGGDERCPSEIECAVSGPVSLSLSAQLGNAEPMDINLQVFTGNNGRAPEMQFEGIQDRADYEGYVIRVTGVLPYPVNRTNLIKDSDYRVTFVIDKK